MRFGPLDSVNFKKMDQVAPLTKAQFAKIKRNQK